MSKPLPWVIAVVALLTSFVLWRKLHEQQELTMEAGEAKARVDRELLDAQASLDHRAADRIADLAHDPDPMIRQRALELLSVWQSEQVRKKLPALLRDETDPRVLLAALDIAGRVKAPETLLAVLDKISSKDPAVRRKAAATLGELSEGLSAEQRERAGQAISVAIEAERAAPVGAPTMNDPGAFLPYIEPLAKLKSTQSVPLLLRFLRDPQPPLRRWSARALKGLAAKEHSEALQAAWRAESDPDARQAIEEILERDPFNITVDRTNNRLVEKK